MAQPRPADDLPEPPQLRRLRRLVSLLMLVLIVGMLVVVAAMVVRLGGFGGGSLAPLSAEHITLPAGASVEAIGQSPSGLMVLTRDAAGAETLRLFDPATGAEISATAVRRE